MKVIEISVRFSVKTEEEGKRILSALGVQGGVENTKADEGVKEGGEGAPKVYVPSSVRTQAAAEVLSKCKRVAVLRLSILDTWESAFPHVDMAGEIMKCEAWAESKGVTRTPRGWQKALNSWLSKAQDTTRGSQMPQAASKPAALALAIEEEVKAWIEAAV